jgi:hypothetical protein
MLIIKHTVETRATPAQIWQVWQDVENWNSWDHDLESSHLDGPFQAGTTGMLKFKGESSFTTVLKQVDPYKIFVQEAKLTFAKVVMTHSIEQIGGTTFVTFQTEIRGPLALLFVCLIGSSIKKKIPLEMAQMLKKAEAL